MNLVRLGGVLTVAAMVGFIVVMRRRDIAGAFGGSRVRRTRLSTVRSRTLIPMLSGIPLFPEQASTLAPQVDNLYFFILGVTAFFALLVVRPGGLLRGQVPRRHRPEGRRADHRLDPARARLVADPVLHRDGDLRLGDAWCSSRSSVRPTRRWRSTPPASAGCGSSSTSTAQREINELHVPVGRPVKVTFTSEDVLHSLYIPAFRVEGRRHSGPLQLDLVHADQDRASTTCSAPSTAAPATPG